MGWFRFGRHEERGRHGVDLGKDPRTWCEMGWFGERRWEKRAYFRERWTWWSELERKNLRNACLIHKGKDVMKRKEAQGTGDESNERKVTLQKENVKQVAVVCKFSALWLYIRPGKKKNTYLEFYVFVFITALLFSQINEVIDKNKTILSGWDLCASFHHRQIF